jgi:FMN phosphatase YigB (HAD superfamily)
VRYRAVVFDLWQTLVPWHVLGANRFYDEAAGSDAYQADMQRPNARMHG